MYYELCCIVPIVPVPYDRNNYSHSGTVPCDTVPSRNIIFKKNFSCFCGKYVQ